MVDDLILPALAVTVVAFLIYVWFGWLRDPRNRSLEMPEDDDDVAPPSGQ